MRGEQMAITCVVGLGFEAVAAFSLAVFLLKAGQFEAKLTGIGLVLVGIIIPRISK
jgi:hypothetical protein